MSAGVSQDLGYFVKSLSTAYAKVKCAQHIASNRAPQCTWADSSGSI